jgi:capsid protein
MFQRIRNIFRRWIGDEPKAPAQNVDAWRKRYADLRATYDAARTTSEYEKIWENADAFDADSAHSKDVRHTLIKRSRYEIGSNGYSDGIAQTYATDLVGVGPTLRMQTGSEGFNRLVELNWYRWCKAVHFRRKLWCMAHAKHQDGEAFGILRRNPGVMHPVKLDVVLHEADQIQTPYVPYDQPGYIDGIKFDEFGNPQWYDLLTEHPGNTHRMFFKFEPERVDASKVVHWFKMRRPGQHRGVPECSSTLNVGAAARRWREATLAAAETAADFTLFLRTQFQPTDEEMQYATDFTQQEIVKRMMTALPIGYEPFQLKAEHPNATHEGFHKSLVNEQARPKSMPYNKAACDSSAYNYASGRLDHQTYYSSLDVEREDCNELVLNPLFDSWFNLAVYRLGWFGGDPNTVNYNAREHIWDWPKHRVADVEAEANANKTRLQSGQLFLHQLFADSGWDLADEITKASESLGAGEDEIKTRLLDVTLPPPKVGSPPAGAPGKETEQAVDAVLAKLNGRANGYAHQ